MLCLLQLINLPMNHDSENHSDWAIISCKIVCENVNNQHVKNIRTDFVVKIIEVLCFLHCTL